ncbi:MAG: tetratricopeptide repeat protein [Bacteroidetes bacterium]|nr:MAG: tetratricopeptide repeat protein [Bacteroidota bacterium]
MKPETTSSSTSRYINARAFFPLLIVACIAIVYFQAFSFDFVSYDDYDLIVYNEEFLSNPGNILTSFTTHAFTGKRAESVYYRPVLQSSYILDYTLWGLRPTGYHLTTLIAHILTSILLFFLLNKLFHRNLFALVGSLLFALHPAQTEAVAWVAGRNDVLLGLFIVLMMLSYVHYREQSEKRFLFLLTSLLAFTLALFTKEPAAFYLLLLPLFDFCLSRKTPDNNPASKYTKQLAPFAAIFVIYLSIRYLLFGDVVGAERLYGNSSLVERFAQAPAIVMQHLSLLILPVNLSIVHPLDSLLWLSQPWNIFSIILLVLLLVAVVISRRYDRVLTFGLLWLVVGLLPVLNIIPLAVPILEHRLYVPLVGFVIIVSSVFRLLHSTKATRVVLPIAYILIMLSGIASFLRVPVWQNSETLWTDAIRKAPAVSRSYFNLSGYFFEKQQYEKVIPLMEKYIELEPLDFIAYTKLRQTYFLAGRYLHAADVCKRMIRLNPTNPERYIEAALLYERINQPDSAVGMYEQGILAVPGAYQLHFRLGLLLEKKQQSDSALYQYNKSCSLNPSFAPPYVLAGRLYASRGEYEKAISSLEQGMSLATPPQEDIELLLSLYLKTKQEQKYNNLLKQNNRY